MLIMAFADLFKCARVYGGALLVMINIECETEFCGAHRLLGHENKCSSLHGHNYIVRVSARSEKLDSLGRVADFSSVKSTVKHWLDEHWDHGTLIYRNDPEMMEISPKLACIGKVYHCEFNPTAENMALYLLNVIFPRLFSQHNFYIWKVEVWETPRNMAQAVNFTTDQ